MSPCSSSDNYYLGSSSSNREIRCLQPSLSISVTHWATTQQSCPRGVLWRTHFMHLGAPLKIAGETRRFLSHVQLQILWFSFTWLTLFTLLSVPTVEKGGKILNTDCESKLIGKSLKRGTVHLKFLWCQSGQDIWMEGTGPTSSFSVAAIEFSAWFMLCVCVCVCRGLNVC